MTEAEIIALHREPEPYLTYEELAQVMRCSVRTVKRMKAEGMPHKTWGRRIIVFDRREALAWAEKRRAA